MLLLYLLFQLSSLVSGQNKTATSLGGDIPYHRSVRYVGGEYVANSNGTTMINELYVEELLPNSGTEAAEPVVLLSGGTNAGTQWLNKPDGDAGWASFFLCKGHAVYLIDSYSVGRSTYSNSTFSSAPVSTVEGVEAGFTSPEKSPLAKYYQKKFHNQWPGAGIPGDPIFDEFYASLVPGDYGPTSQTAMQKSVCTLLSQLSRPVVLISHSIGASPAFLATDKCPEKVKAHVSVEGDTSPFATQNIAVAGIPDPIRKRPYGLSDVPLNYDPPISDPSELNPQKNGSTEQDDGLLSQQYCFTQGSAVQANSTQANNTQSSASVIHKLPNIAKAPVLQLTGQGSVHAVYDHCLVEYLRLTGVTVTWAQLADEGITGNGHFMMLEKNSDQIASFVYDWIRGLGNKRRSIKPKVWNG